MPKLSDYVAMPLSVLGSVEGVLQAFPATNADGTANPAAQNQAVQAVVAAFLNAGVINFPGVTTDKLTTLASSLVTTILAYKAATHKTEL